MENGILLSVAGLTTSFATESGRLPAVEDVTFHVRRGEMLGLVGESGCGKSVTALSIMRLLPKPSGRIENGRIVLAGTDITALPADEMRHVRGNQAAMIFQEPMTALNPVHQIGRQLNEIILRHKLAENRKQAAQKSLHMLKEVGIPDPERRMKEYPHQISGGMRQRVMIAMALACDPNLLIADEPTTALDVTIQAQILDLIKVMQRERNMSVMLITHDLGVIAETCDRVCVMYAGRIVETADVQTLFAQPAHPYTIGLLAAIPRLENQRKTRLAVIPGMVPSLADLPPGCRFQNRCFRAEAICREKEPPFVDVDQDHQSACYFAPEVKDHHANRPTAD